MTLNCLAVRTINKLQISPAPNLYARVRDLQGAGEERNALHKGGEAGLLLSRQRQEDLLELVEQRRQLQLALLQRAAGQQHDAPRGHVDGVDVDLLGGGRVPHRLQQHLGGGWADRRHGVMSGWRVKINSTTALVFGTPTPKTGSGYF